MSEAPAETAASLAPWVSRQVALLAGRPGHAWLLHGAAGLGQWEIGRALVAAWLCDQPSAQGACGTCSSCHSVRVHTHPDLVMLTPETWALAHDLPLLPSSRKAIDDKVRKPSKEIRVEAMREMVEFALRTASRGRGKAVLIYPAERMNAVSANTLLKTLEEPAGDTRFVLLSEASHLLLPTIRSRCLSHALPEPLPDEAAEWLQARGVRAADAPILLKAAGGRPMAAWRMEQEGQGADFWRRLPKAVVHGEVGLFSGLAAPLLVDALQKLCHDLMRVAAGGGPRFLDAESLPKAPDLRTLEAWERELAWSARHAEHPLQPGLVVEALVSRARRAVHCPPT